MSSSVSLRDTDLQNAVSELAGVQTKLPIEVEGGSNSRVYRVEAKDSVYALKHYLKVDEVSRDRLGTEYRALTFLRRHGVTCVPTPVAVDRSQGLSLCEWIEGEEISEPSDDDLSAALEFVRTLHTLRRADGADDLPLATETCLSLGELIRQIERRVNLLADVAQDNSRLSDFITAGIMPCIEKADAAARSEYRQAGMDAESDLAPIYRTLSPADFGFHNMRHDSNGRLMFLDFEYFGWDDPVKLATEFLVHPGMSLRPDQKLRFVAEVTEIYRDDPNFVTRMHLLFPLYGLRWSLIALNRFLPDHWARETKEHGDLGRELVLERQLDKAEILLNIAHRGITGFPYGC